jgi:hypothetical protein
MIGDIGKKMGRDGIDNGYIQVSDDVGHCTIAVSADACDHSSPIVSVHTRQDPKSSYADETHPSLARWNRDRSSE